jgi:hypothetical protein
MFIVKVNIPLPRTPLGVTCGGVTIKCLQHVIPKRRDLGSVILRNSINITPLWGCQALIKKHRSRQIRDRYTIYDLRSLKVSFVNRKSYIGNHISYIDPESVGIDVSSLTPFYKENGQTENTRRNTF